MNNPHTVIKQIKTCKSKYLQIFILLKLKSDPSGDRTHIYSLGNYCSIR